MAKIIQNKITNKIINSGFQIAQRGTSSSASGYLIDRFAWNAIAGGGTPAAFTQSQQVMPVGGDAAFKTQPSHFFRLNNTTLGTSLGLNSAHYLVHSIEDVSSVKSGINTLSFYARSSIVNKQINVGLYQQFGSGGSTAVPVAGTTITLTASWKRYVIPFNVASIAGKTLGANNNLTVLLYFQQGATDAANYGLSGIGFGGTGDTDITEMQFNEGGLIDYAPQGTSLPHELALCQRYFEIIGGPNSITTQLGAGLSVNTTIASGTAIFKTTKRVNPAVTFSSQTGFRFSNASNNFASSAMAVSVTTPYSLGFNLTTAGMAGGNIPGNMDSASTAAIFVDAEY
jgi:hypothetical protein